MADFPTPPTLSQGESPSLYKIDGEDNVNKADTEGGYEFRRRRFTRTPRSQFETGFLFLPDDDYLVLKAFWDVHLCDVAFTWVDYLHDDLERQVRFDEFKPEYVGIGTNKMWHIKIKMSEV